MFFLRYQNDYPEILEKCTYYNRNYSILAKNGYNWSIEHLDNVTSIPCQYYSYNNKDSVVTEVHNIYLFKN